MIPFDFILGVDPGANGGIVGLECDTKKIFYMSRFFQRLETSQFFKELESTTQKRKCVCYLEKNSGYMGGQGNTGSSMFAFGRSTGIVEGFLVALQIPIVEVTPSVWHRDMDIETRKIYESTHSWKKRLQEMAFELAKRNEGHEIVLPLPLADAYLIAEYGRRIVSHCE